MEQAPVPHGSPEAVTAEGSAPRLTIGDLAERTGLSTPTLRMWEARHGFPVPHRLQSGHRRYTDDDVEAIRSVVRHKQDGLRLHQAIARARDERPPSAPSIYSVLRERHPSIPTYRLTKRTLVGVSRAIEDEFCAQAHEADIYGAFQEGRWFQHAEQRWSEIARTARSATVFADFERSDPDTSPARVRLAADAPMLREWALVCDAPDLPVVLTGWEVPGQTGVPDRERCFETMWTVEPHAVHDAARVCASVAGQPELPAAPRGQTHPDIRSVTLLYNRIVWYLDKLD